MTEKIEQNKSIAISNLKDYLSTDPRNMHQRNVKKDSITLQNFEKALSELLTVTFGLPSIIEPDDILESVIRMLKIEYVNNSRKRNNKIPEREYEINGFPFSTTFGLKGVLVFDKNVYKFSWDIDYTINDI